MCLCGNHIGRSFFVRIRDSDYREQVAILELKEERETYVVAPSLVPELAGEVRLVEIRLCISRSGVVFLWPVPLPAEDGRSHAWHETAREAAELAETRWVRMSANMGAGCYDVAMAPDGVSDPKWPEHTFRNCLGLPSARASSSTPSIILCSSGYVENDAPAWLARLGFRQSGRSISSLCARPGHRPAVVCMVAKCFLTGASDSALGRRTGSLPVQL